MNQTNNPYINCGVDEEMFPCMDKCCHKSDSPLLNSYETICGYCDIMSSFPYGEKLEIITIFECRLLGYGKRIDE
jgi:hypothetical protein